MLAVASSACAELTQAQLSQAIIEALWNYNLTVEALPLPPLGTGEFVTYPIDENYEPLSFYLGDGTGTAGAYLLRILNTLAEMSASTNDFSAIVHQLDHNQQDTLGETLVYWLTAINDNLEDDTYGTPLLNKIRNLTYTQDNELRVHDDQLADVLYQLSGMEQTMTGDTQALTVSVSSNLNELVEYWNEDPSTTESEAEQDALDSLDDEEAEASEEFGYISLPSASDSYTPSTPTDQVQGEDLGLTSANESAPVQHSALVQLIDGNATTSIPIGSASDRSTVRLPTVEIDFGRMSNFVSGLSRFGSYLSWLYGVLFALLLSVKALSMWRVVRIASTAGACGVDPPVHLAFNPF